MASHETPTHLTLEMGKLRPGEANLYVQGPVVNLVVRTRDATQM